MNPIVHLFHGCHRVQRQMTGLQKQMKLSNITSRSDAASEETLYLCTLEMFDPQMKTRDWHFKKNSFH